MPDDIITYKVTDAKECKKAERKRGWFGRLICVFYRAWKEYASDGGNYWVRLAWERGCLAGERRYGGLNPYKPGTDAFEAWERGHYVGTKNVLP